MRAQVEGLIDNQDRRAPGRFNLGQAWVEVQEVLDFWPSSESVYVKVRGEDSAVYIFRHTKETNQWELTLFDRDGSEYET